MEYREILRIWTFGLRQQTKIVILHSNINFDDAESHSIKHDIGNGVILNVVDFDYLRKMKVITHRVKDWSDVVQLDEFKKKGGDA